MELRERQATWNGFGNGLCQAVEMVAAPVLFAIVRVVPRHAFRYRPVLAITLGVFGVAGMAARSYYSYRAAIEREEEGKPWTRSRK